MDQFVNTFPVNRLAESVSALEFMTLLNLKNKEVGIILLQRKNNVMDGKCYKDRYRKGKGKKCCKEGRIGVVTCKEGCE